MSTFPTQQFALLGLEAVLTITLVLTLFRLRSRLGLAPLFVTLGVFQPIQVLLGSSVYIELLPGKVISPGSVVIFSTSLATVLLLYILEDAIEARKAIYGIILANLTTTLLLILAGFHLEFAGAVNFLELPIALFHQNARIMVVSTFFMFLDVILIIFTYEMFWRWIKKSLFLRLFLTLAGILVLDHLGFYTGAFGDRPDFGALLVPGLVAKIFVALFFAWSMTIYLKHLEPADHAMKPF